MVPRKYLLSLVTILLFAMFVSSAVFAQVESFDKQFDEMTKEIQEGQKQVKEQQQTIFNLSGLIFKVILGGGLLIIILAIVNLIGFIWSLVDISKAKNDTGWKILWIAICFFLGILGVIIYFVTGRKQKKQN